MWQQKFPKNNWTAFLIQHANPLQLQPNDVLAFLKVLVDECAEFLEGGRTGKAIDRISLGCVLDKPEFLSRLKKKGLLRHSHYIKLRDPVTGIAKHFLAFRHFLNLTNEEVLYFESLQNLEKFSIEMRSIFQSIAQTLFKYKVRKTTFIGEIPVRASVIKSLLAINEYAFLNRPNEDPAMIEDISGIAFSMEERCDAISFLLSTADELIHIETKDLLMIDEGFIASKQSEELIIQACCFKAYKEVEILVESLGYVCKKKGNLFIIGYEDDRTFRSLELSHIIGHTQKQADSIYVKRAFKHLPSIQELAADVNKSFPDMVELKKLPYARFTLNLPTILVAAISKEDIGYFSEEYDALEYIQNDMSLSLTDLEKYEVADGLTLHDLMKIDRIFAVLQNIYCEKIKEQTKPESHMAVLNSILANFSLERMLDLFDGIISKEKVLKYLESMSWNAGENKYLDLQYTPIVHKDKQYLVSLSVMRHSRMVRNIAASLSKKGLNVKAGQIKLLEQVPKQLSDVFSKQAFICLTDLKIYYQGQIQSEGDIDFFAFKDDHLFIGECKDVLDSVDSFEYRRINDYLIKAASQLDYLKSALADPQYQADLSKRVGIDLSKVKEIHFLIIPTARKMYGHSVNGYPVRYLHELTAFVKEGIWNFKLPGGIPHSFELWDRECFEVTDLINFCSPTGPHDEFFKALVGFSKPIGKNIEENRYALDIQTAFENLKKRYRYIQHAAEAVEE